MLLFFDDYSIPLKERVSFVTWKVEFVLILCYDSGGPLRDFPPVLELFVVWERKFPQSHEGEEAGQKHSQE